MSSLKPSILRSQIAAVRKKLPAARVLALKTRSRWEGDSSLATNDEQYLVRQCDSELAIREAMLDAEDAGYPLVVVTGMQENHLGGDVLARLARRKLLRIDIWDGVGDLFQASKIDPRARQYGWLADALIADPPSDGYSPAANGVLTVEHMWGEFLRYELKMPASKPDPFNILMWSLDSAVTGKYMRLEEERRADIERWVSNSAGELGVFLLHCVGGGKAAMIVPCGLVCEILCAENSGNQAALRDATIRMEKHTVDQHVRLETGRPWAKSSIELVGEHKSQGRIADIDRIREFLDRLIVELGLQDFAWLSQISSVGFEQRMDRFAQALSVHLNGSQAQDVRLLWDLANHASLHLDAKSAPQRIERLYMACRLCSWLQKTKEDSEADGDFHVLTEKYFEEDSFSDWARNSVYSGEGSENLAKSYGKLLKIVDGVRQQQNHRFALKLANWVEAGAPSNGIIRIEDVLTRVVAEVARRAPVLLVVCDGMSMAVYRQLIEDITLRNKWTEQGPEGQPWPTPVIAALPTTTEVSRCSLFCGRITNGQKDDEAQGFRTHPSLVQVSRNQEPLLYTKSELMDGAGVELASDLSTEIRSSRRQVIGVVVNAIDDYLLKGEQVAFPWTVSHIPVLEKLLFAAKEANRVVVLTSDHGHVLERHSKGRSHEPGERYRTDGHPPQPDEILIFGTRVGIEASRFVAPWDEHVRYSMKKNGYHGGVTPQEVVIPVAVLTYQQEIPGWSSLPLLSPDWWTAEGTQNIPSKPVTQAEIKVGTPSEGLPLFSTAKTQCLGTGADWIDAALSSQVMTEQRTLAGRSMLTDDRIKLFLTVLDAHGGTILVPALAQKMGQPLLRIRGIVTVMQRILNVEGYSVLSYDAASESVTLNKEMLRKQFEIQ
jgi:hypothetical protein